MSANIPTPFNFGRTAAGSDPLFDSNDTSDGGGLDTSGGDATGVLKTGGGLPSNTDGVTFTVTTGKAGFRYYFNSTPSSLDFTATGEKRILMFGTQANAVNRRQLASVSSGGQSLKMYSGSDTTSEIREWVLGGSDTFLATRTGVFLFAIDPEANGTVTDVGTFDPTDVLRYGHFNTKGNMVGGGSAFWFWCAAVLVSSEKNSTDIPRIHGSSSSWQDLVDAVQGTTDFTGQNHLYVEKAGNVVNLFCPCSIGNSSQASPSVTNFDDNGVTVVSPSSNSASDPRFHLTTDSMRFYLDLRDSASDTATFSGTYTWGTEAPFDFSQSDSASITLDGASFSGMGEFTCGSSVSGNAIFTLGGTNKVLINGANLDGSTINGDADLQGGTVTTLTNITVTGVLDFDTAGTYTLDGCTISEVTNSSGGAITLSLTNGSTVTTNTGPNITLEQSVNITAPNIIDGSRVQIYNVTKSAEIDNSIVSGGSGYSTSVNLLSASVDDGDTIRLRVTYTSGTSAKSEALATGIIGTNGLSFLTTQDNDDAYNTLALDGSTITKFTADYVNDEVDISVASDFTLAEFYAWWVYNTTTSQGISEFFGGVTAIDEANFRINNSVVNIYLDNATATNISQTDNRRLYRVDGARPVVNSTSGGGGIDVEWRSPVTIAASESIQSNLTDILDDTDELQQNQGDWLTATGFSTFNPASDQVTVATNNDKTGYSLTNADKDDIVDRNWDESYSQHTTAGTFGKLMDLLRKANRAIEGGVTGTPTISSFSTNLTGYAEGTFDSELLVFVSGSINGEARPILNYSSGTFTFEEEWTQAPGSGDEFVILPQHIHPISQIQEGLDTLRNVKPSIPI